MISRRAAYGFIPAIAIVIANMIGTGVFTSLGFQLVELRSPFVVLLLWTLGGVAAFCGAVSYAELGAALPRSGGEYQFLSRIFHPAAGFVSGWVSVTIGFAAPTALAAMTFAAYASSAAFDGASALQEKLLACTLVISLGALHGWKRNASGVFQTIFTVIKVAVILMFCAAAFFLAKELEAAEFLPATKDVDLITSSGFAVSLIYVSFAYTGWNAATYLSGEITNPKRNLPIILGGGAFVVTILYVALNAAFLASAPMDELVGKVEIGFIAARSLFGEGAGSVTALVMAGLLISTVSAMTIAGPRVLQVIGEDYALFKSLAALNRDAIPRRAIFLQSALAVIFILTASFQSVLVFAGSLVALNSFFTVLGLYILRWREPGLPRPYKVFGYPFTPAIYLCVTGWAIVFALLSRPLEGAFIVGLLALGGALYVVSNRKGRTGDL